MDAESQVTWDEVERRLWHDTPLYNLMCRVVNGELSDWEIGAGERSHVEYMTSPTGREVMRMSVQADTVADANRLDMAQEWIWGLKECLAEIYNTYNEQFSAADEEMVHRMIERSQIFVLDLEMGAETTYEQEKHVIAEILPPRGGRV